MNYKYMTVKSPSVRGKLIHWVRYTDGETLDRQAAMCGKRPTRNKSDLTATWDIEPAELATCGWCIDRLPMEKRKQLYPITSEAARNAVEV